MNENITSCGGGNCGCGSRDETATVARVNGVALHGPGERLDEAELRQRAYSELLRQQAQREGRLALADQPAVDGVLSAAASAAIEALLESTLQPAEPDEAACRRHHAAHAARYAVGERVLAAHILFALTPATPVEALRRRAEALLVELRCADAMAFARAAADNSNCPSGAQGGSLGWLSRADCMPEFAATLFGQDEAQAHVGVLPRLLRSRHGFHIVKVDAREAGQRLPFQAVHRTIAQTLEQQARMTALCQYLNGLAAEAVLDGVVLEGASTPLLQ
ncbi:peptidylprolyl isomerase [Roseateles sp. DAIF2]|uniref:peptidylprolyl isomerase n=1 Tax=Roseateles sp. DAIF2 TaxID=2714952 RepID=UPI0018A2DF21|nr:peptidylprolyl isomerase [Roseateles sp. DAIF2]QPF74022.1 peptidylprolyl isomerase [Roseateles sp. DAIF2]